MGRRQRGLWMIVAGLLACGAAAPAAAQTGCRTLNCASATPPAPCQDRAAPRTLRILMTGSLFTSRFEPDDPRIEPGMCVEWAPSSTQHTSTGSGNPATCTDTTCPPNLCQSPDCEWDTGNVDPVDPSVFCHYDPAVFAGGTTEAFCCRIHFNVGMTGTMAITTPIALSVDKAGGDLVLDWTGGGVVGDETFKVQRSDEKTFATVLTVDPDAGPAGRSFTDAGELASGLNRYYLVRNRQSTD